MYLLPKVCRYFEDAVSAILPVNFGELPALTKIRHTFFFEAVAEYPFHPGTEKIERALLHCRSIDRPAAGIEFSAQLVKSRQQRTGGQNSSKNTFGKLFVDLLLFSDLNQIALHGKHLSVSNLELI